MFGITLYLLQYTDLLNPSPNNFVSFALSSFDKVTTGAQSFASVIVKAALSTKLVKMQFLFHVNETSTLQLINGISNDLQKLLKYFNGTAIFTPFLLVIRLDLYLYDDELFGI